MPVLPLVGSMISAPGFSLPSFSAASIMANAILSFTELPGLKDSTFTTTSAWPLFSLLMRTNGVFPIFSRMFDAMLM